MAMLVYGYGSYLGKVQYFTNLNEDHLGMIPLTFTIIYGEVVVRSLLNLPRSYHHILLEMCVSWYRAYGPRPGAGMDRRLYFEYFEPRPNGSAPKI